MRKMVFILIALLMLSCAQNYIWQNPDKDPYAYNNDADGCNTEARRVSGEVARKMRGEENAEMSIDNAYDRAFDSCMEAKGWRKVKE